MSTTGELEINNCKFTWKIKDFSKQCKQVSDKIDSPVFKVENFNDCHWKLRLYPFGTDDHTEDHLSLYLRNESQKDVDVCFKVILTDINEKLIICRNVHCKFVPQKGHGWAHFISRVSILKEKDGLPDDLLNVTCIISKGMYSEEEMVMNETILDNYKLLLSDEVLSDVTITIENTKMKAHKNILSARSKVFAAMFNHDMEENNTDSVQITDVRYEIMKDLLLFIYCGKVKNLKDNEKELLAAAEKYEIMDLAVLCEKNLWKSIKIENACKILHIADFYNRSALKAKVKEYVVTNIKEINKTGEFEYLLKSDPQLYGEIVSEIIEKKL